MQAQQVEVALRPDLGFLLGLIDPCDDKRAAARRQLPPVLADWNGGLIFELALTLLPLTGANQLSRGRKLIVEDVADYAGALARAGAIVRDWPSAFVSSLEEKLKERALHRANPRYTGIDAYIAGLTSDVLHEQVRLEIEARLAPLRSQPRSFPKGQIGMREAALLTGQMEHRLAEARRQGALQTRICIRANRVLPTLDLSEVELVDDLLSNRIGFEQASAKLGLPQYAIWLLIEEGLVRPMEHPYISFQHGEGQLHRSELERFINALRGAACSAEQIKRPVSLSQVVRGIRGGLKPWGKIFRKLLSGEVQFSLRDSQIRQIFISNGDSASIRHSPLASAKLMMSRKPCTQRDALEILNLAPKHAIHLGAALKADAKCRTPWNDIERFAEAYVSTRELCARTGFHGSALLGQLKVAGLARHQSVFWPRSQTLAMRGLS